MARATQSICDSTANMAWGSPGPGQKKGLWKYKAPDWIDPGVKEIETVTEEDEVLEELIEVDNEIRETAKESQSKTYAQHHEEKLAEQEIPKDVFTQKLLDELECGVNPHKLECLEKSNETSNTSSDTPHTDR